MEKSGLEMKNEKYVTKYWKSLEVLFLRQITKTPVLSQFKNANKIRFYINGD